MGRVCTISRDIDGSVGRSIITNGGMDVCVLARKNMKWDNEHQWGTARRDDEEDR